MNTTITPDLVRRLLDPEATTHSQAFNQGTVMDVYEAYLQVSATLGAAAAKLAAVETLADQYGNREAYEAGDTEEPAPEDRWRFHRDLRRVLAGRPTWNQEYSARKEAGQ